MKYTTILLAILIWGCNSEILEEYIVEEKDFVPEGIAYSKKKDAFYLTSVTKSKILEVDRKTGKQRDFIPEHGFGYTPGVGIYVDDEKGLLHAIGGYYMLPDSFSSLFTFDLHTQKLLNKYDVTDEGEHFLNDMIMDKQGNMYLTNSKDSSVYVLRQGSDTLELFYQSSEIDFPNGIAISEDNSKLYIASIPKGVRVLELSTKKLLNKQDTLGISQGIDGLEFYENNLYGIQNSLGANSFNFRKLILNEAQDAIIDVEVIDSDPPRLDVPLTFCIAENKAVVIANSNLQYLNQKTLEFEQSDSIRKTKLLTYSIE